MEVAVWGKIILAVLDFINWMVQAGQENKWISIGQDQAIAVAQAEILRKTEYGKNALVEFSGKSASDVDDFLRSLEPGNTPRQ